MASRSADPNAAPTLRERLSALGLSPNKALGQNFLHDRAIVRRIADSARIEPGEVVLEIGPGLGILTEELATRAERVVAVELDVRLAGRLPSVMPANVEIVEADALEIDPAKLAGPRFVVVANLPYSSGTAIVRHLQEAQPPPRALTVMLQREVAERMAAAPPNMSNLAVGVQFYGAPKVLFRVGGGAFAPAPRVESAVIRIVSCPPPLPRESHAAFFRVVNAGFGQKRKQLANALSSGLFLPRDAVLLALERAGVPPTERAERLSVADWVRLCQAFDGAAG
ncbi:MAG TPA: 16S rRNA (adenine(1518)-N(6)/adenine(1519)-N(6))-dimethyltransferase RsmA [Thermomicrobiales bacterium]|nr:16S rRNA (adenine(1518)-N(6)/adenine(1519)-N(6))-dimethyltransferase RsmA [Thermomicrobiales bacterium]